MRASRTARPPIVGRASQCAQLRVALDEVVGSGSRFVLVGGEAGAGKTTLVDAFVAELSGGLADRKAQVIRGQCVPLGGEGLPYAPVVGALRDLLALHGRDQILDWAGPSRPGLGAVLPDLVPAPNDSDSIRLRLYEAIAHLWERASEHGPLVVVIEDIHWADESTRHLLRFLVRALTEASVLMIATYRTDELTRRHPLRPFLAEVGRFPETRRVDVPSLDREEVVQLLTRLLGHPPTAVVADLVHRRSEGIPYFVEELATSAARGCVDMPDTLRDALNVRIQALSDSAQDTLRLAAVAGQRIDHKLLETVAAAPSRELEAGLREAVDAAVLTADDTGYVFRHALLREVIHDDLLPGQHARLHAEFAAALEGHPELLRPDVAALEIAHHWSAAHEVTKAFIWSMKAAGSGSAAHHEALKMYERALELWDQVADPESAGGTRAQVLQRAAVAATDAGEPERALALIDAALEDPSAQPDERAFRLLIKSRLLASLMRTGSVSAAREAVAATPEGAPARFRAWVLDQLATSLMLAGDRRAAALAADEAIAAARLEGSATREANARITRGSSLVAIGEEAAGLAELDRGGQLAHTDMRTHVRFYINYSDSLFITGHFDAAVEQALTGFEMARTLGLERSLGAMLAGNAAEPMMARGEWMRALRLIRRALELDPPAHHRAHLRLLEASLTTWRGELDEADASLAEFRHLIADDQPAPQYSLGAIRVDAEHAIASGDPERAWRDCVCFFDHWSLYQAPLVYPALAIAAAAAHALDHVDGGNRSERVRDGLRRALPSGVRAYWEPVILAELEDSPEAWHRVLDSPDGRRRPAHLLPYAGLRLAQHLVATRERAQARQVLSVAAAQAESIGSGLLEMRINTLAQRAGFTVSDDRGIQPLARLTPRELEVLQLVAAGRSNGEIGDALFISTKTASVHVSNILAKLGVSGRGEAAALAYRVGLTDGSGPAYARSDSHHGTSG